MSKNLPKLAVSGRGFTIVELLIVIVVIGILAAIVLNSFTGVQAKARDTERDSDVTAISSQLEAFYNGDGQGSYPNTYPGFADGSSSKYVNLRKDSDVVAKLKGIDLNALRAPNQSSNSVKASLASSTVTPTVGTSTSSTTTTNVASTSGYLYQPLKSDNSICDTEGQACVKFNIYYVKELMPTLVVTKSSINR